MIEVNSSSVIAIKPLHKKMRSLSHVEKHDGDLMLLFLPCSNVRRLPPSSLLNSAMEERVFIHSLIFISTLAHTLNTFFVISFFFHVQF